MTPDTVIPANAGIQFVLTRCSHATFTSRPWPGGVIGGVIGGVTGVLDYIRGHQGENAAEIATALNMPKRSIERFLKVLRDENVIVFRGAPKTGGYFIV